MVTTVDGDWNADDARRRARRLSLSARLAAAFATGRAALRDAGAAPGSGSELVRATNLAAGVAESLGLARPEIWTYAGPPNALGVKGSPAVIALSSELLTAYSRTEIEAVIAHLLQRIARPERSELIGYADDVRTAALTRFPPALASALEKAVPYEGRFARHYLVADADSHRPVAERVAALKDL